MNTKQWRKLGYKTMFRSGRDWFNEFFILLYRPATGITIAAPVDNGRWMQFNDVNKKPWQHITEQLTKEQADNLRRSAEDCYCDSMGGYIETCDFCAGRRS